MLCSLKHKLIIKHSNIVLKGNFSLLEYQISKINMLLLDIIVTFNKVNQIMIKRFYSNFNFVF